MSEEGDIGLYDLSRRSDSLRSTPGKKATRRTSIMSILRGEDKAPLKSSSNPNLLKGSPKGAQRKLSRSNTLPRLPRGTTSSEGPLEDFGGLSMESAKVDLMRRWLLALVIVDFDLDYGPKITTIYPSLSLSAAEEGNIAFLSFPDSPQTESGSYIHSFRLRCPESIRTAGLGDVSPSQDSFIYGFSHFTQRRDSRSKRGYQQRSLVILTQHAYPSLFYTLLSHLGQAFLSHGGPMLEVACHNVANWPDPCPSATLELGFLGYVFTADIPSSSDNQQSKPPKRSFEKQGADTHIVATLAPQTPPIIAAFEACLPNLWSIWECLLLCEPIVVFGPSAAMTSQAVWWLRDILRPTPLAGDFRPFFTIHDTDHASLVNSRAPQPGLLIGVTNPFFAKACSHWPHVLSLGPPRGKKATQTTADIPVGPAPGWSTKTHKRHIAKDQALLRKMEEACQGDERAKLQVSEILRQHFAARTTAFLVPIQRYLNTLIPTHADRSTTPSPTSSSANFPSSRSMSRATTQPSTSSRSLLVPGPALPQLRLRPFHQDAFFASLKENGSPLPFKSTAKRKEFYEKWLRTRAFGLWLAAQEEVVNRVLSEPPQSAAVSVKGASRDHSPASIGSGSSR